MMTKKRTIDAYFGIPKAKKTRGFDPQICDAKTRIPVMFLFPCIQFRKGHGVADVFIRDLDPERE